MYQKLSNRLKEQAFLSHKPVSFVASCPPPSPVKCIPPLEHNRLKLSRVINLAPCRRASAQRALALVPFAPIQCNPAPVSGRVASRRWRRHTVPSLRANHSAAAPSLGFARGASLPGGVVLPARSEPWGGGNATGNDNPDRFAISLTLITLFFLFLFFFSVILSAFWLG